MLLGDKRHLYECFSQGLTRKTMNPQPPDHESRTAITTQHHLLKIAPK